MRGTREAAKRLCFELDRHGLTALPHRSGRIVVKDGCKRQDVLLRATDEAGGFHWFWVWETDDEPLIDRGLPMGEEVELARRLAEVMSYPDLGGSTR